MRFRLTAAVFVIFMTAGVHAQPRGQAPTFTRADTLRGALTPLRTCYDVTFYHLDVRIDPESKSVSGSNTIHFKVMQDFDRMQVDLFENMEIHRITHGGRELSFQRDYGAIFIDFPSRLKQGSEDKIEIFYGGMPQVARRPPWDGGLIWSEDAEGNPWVAVTCQGTGASLWWPNKEHQSDEPDSMLLSTTVPPGLTSISNGRLRRKTDLEDGWHRYDWFISYPINNYNVTLNIGKFAHFAEQYNDLTLDYYVKPADLDQARRQFTQVKPMMACFERFFGAYPFKRDGFKLVQSPHLGMEHQTAVAYGNRFLQGYLGRASSEVGTKFDFIIVHETAHEWWGNSVTAKDIADMWIHESFGAYAEAVYVECLFGYDEAMKYVNGKKGNVGNQRPIIGVYGVNHEGSGDMYDKGQLFLNTLRHVVDNDSLWWATVLGLAETFKYQTITADDVFDYVNRKTGMDHSATFNQYLKYPEIPTLQVNITRRGSATQARYRWRAGAADFAMPVKVTVAKDDFRFIRPTTRWQTTALDLHPDEFKVAENQFYIDVRVRRSYVYEPQDN